MRLTVVVLIAAAGLIQPQEVSHTTPPRVIHTVRPEYTKEALDAKLQGTVVLSALVAVDGLPSEIKLVRELGRGLNEKAIECLRQCRFSPGLSRGEPIPVKVTVEIEFRIPN
jgi:TonB family protein